MTHIEKCERIFRFYRCLSPCLGNLPVCLGLARLGIEIFDRFIIEQTINRTRHRLRVQIVHLFAQLGAPIGHALGEKYIGDDHHHRCRDQAKAELRPENDRHPDQFNHRRRNVEQEEIEHDINAFGAALNHLGDRACPPVHVEPHREIVEMRKDIFGQTPRGILPDAFEHRVAQIIEQHPGKSCARISSNQRNRDGDAAFLPRCHPVNRLAIEPAHAEHDEF